MKFGTVGSPKSTPLNPGGSVGAIIQMRSLGLDALELGWVQSVNVSQETCARIKSTAVSNSISLSIHAPYFINLNAGEEEWPKSRKRLWDASFYGYLAGATDIVFHPGSYFSEEPKVVLDKILPRLNLLSEELKTANINITLRPETMGKSAMLGSLEDTLIMSKEIENIFPCLDFAHLHARPGDGSCNTLNEWLGVLDQYSNILGEQSLQNLHIHLSGIEYGAKGEKKHLPIKNSDLNVRSLLNALQLRKCDGRILCESPILEEDAIFLQELWNKK